MGGQASAEEQPREDEANAGEQPYNEATSSTSPAPKCDVKELCSAILTDDFWECFGSRPFYRAGVANGYGSMISVDDLFDALVRGSDSDATSAYKHGEPCMRENIFVAYLDQCTLSLSEAEHFFPWLYDLCQTFRPSLDFVTCRLLLDPPNMRPPPLQTESHLIVVQLWGNTQLQVGVNGSKEVHAMMPGDLLYAPRGMACEIRAGEGSQPSLYLLLSISTADQTLGQSLGRYFLDALREELPPELDAFMRSAVTRHTATDSATSSSVVGPVDAESLNAELSRHASEMASRISLDGLQKHYEARMQKAASDQAAGAARLSGPKAPQLPANKLRTDTVVRLAPAVACRCQPGSNHAHFQRGSATLTMQICTTASYLINHIADGRAKGISSLPCDDPVERLCVCQVLLFKECLEVA